MAMGIILVLLCISPGTVLKPWLFLILPLVDAFQTLDPLVQVAVQGGLFCVLGVYLVYTMREVFINDDSHQTLDKKQ